MINQKDLQWLVSADIITQKQADNILKFQGTKKEWWGIWFSQSIVTIWAILIWFWVLSLIALNREGMTDFVKIWIMLSSTVATFLLGRYFKEKWKTIIGWALLFMSGLLVSGSIFLVAQIYNLTVTNDILLGLWIILILPLVYLLRQKEFYYLYMILLSCVLWIFLSSHTFAVADERNMFVLYILFGFAMILAWYIHDHIYDDNLLANLYKIFWVNIAAISYFIFTVSSTNSSNSYMFPSIIIYIATAILLWYGIYFVWKNKSDALYIAVALLVLSFWLLMSNFELINYSIFIICCLLAIYLWYKNQNNAIIRTANVYLYLFLLYLYGIYWRQYQDKALFFIVGGILMIALWVWFSKLNSIMPDILDSNDDTQWKIKK